MNRRVIVGVLAFVVVAGLQSVLAAQHYHNNDGSRFVPKDFYPKFSWDTTPMYYMFGDGQQVLHAEEVEFIAERTDFLCIEKSHGRAELGAAELGAKHEAAAFKKMLPQGNS